MNRRNFFNSVAGGIHGAALTYLLGKDVYARSANPPARPRGFDLRPKPTHHTPKAKAVIQLFQNGGPSQVDLFDPKPMLEKFAGSAPSRDIVNQIEFADQVG